MLDAVLLASFRLYCVVRHAVYSALSLLLPWVFPKHAINQPRPTNVILISGASTGIGRNLALYLARQGFTVLAGVRRQADGEALLKEFIGDEHTASGSPGTGSGGGALVPLQLDVAKEESVKTAVETVTALLSSVPAPHSTNLVAVINNAGVSPPPCPVEMLDLNSLDRLLAVNLHGVIRVTQAFLPLLRQTAKRTGYGRARVVMVSSANGFMAVPGLGAYVASKFALEGLTDCLRAELRAQGIGCSIIQPGPVLTPIFQKAIEQATPVRKSLSAQLRQECEQQLYTRYLFGHGAEKSMEGMLKHFAVSTRLTTAQLEHSVCSPFPAVRYRTGPLARGMQLVKWFLPDDVTDAVVSGLYGLMAALD